MTSFNLKVCISGTGLLAILGIVVHETFAIKSTIESKRKERQSIQRTLFAMKEFREQVSRNAYTGMGNYYDILLLFLNRNDEYQSGCFSQVSLTGIVRLFTNVDYLFSLAKNIIRTQGKLHRIPLKAGLASLSFRWFGIKLPVLEVSDDQLMYEKWPEMDWLLCTFREFSIAAENLLVGAKNHQPVFISNDKMVTISAFYYGSVSPFVKQKYHEVIEQDGPVNYMEKCNQIFDQWPRLTEDQIRRGLRRSEGN